MAISAVLFDFYGTLARATRWVSADEVLSEHGYTLTDEHRAIYFADGLDGVEHLERLWVARRPAPNGSILLAEKGRTTRKSIDQAAD